MSRRSIFVGWLAVAAVASIARAQAPDDPAKPTPIVLRPAAAPVPALKYQLLPEHRTLVPGNAAIFYHRAIELTFRNRTHEQHGNIQTDPSLTDEKVIDGWLNDPLSSIPLERAQRVLEPSRNSLHEVELGARRQNCDWEFERREESFYLLLEEIQQMRSLARLVALRARVAVLEGRTDDAFHWIQTGFAMARHASEGPVLVQSLVGAYITRVMCGPLVDLIQAPGAPSLYWAISRRPHPLTDFSAGFEGDRLVLEREIPSLRELNGPAWSVERARDFSAELQEKLFKLNEIAEGSGTSDLRGWTHRLGMAALVIQVYPEAKRALIAQGRSAEQVDAMPAVQVAVLHTFREYEKLRDDVFKWTSLPYYQSYRGMDDAMAESRLRSNKNMLLKLFTMLISSVRSVGLALALSERRLDAIQCIEAIREYAAIHGKLPSRLEEITELPVPIDIATGKAFEYRANGDRATLSAPFPPGGIDTPAHKINYELILTR